MVSFKALFFSAAVLSSAVVQASPLPFEMFTSCEGDGCKHNREPPVTPAPPAKTPPAPAPPPPTPKAPEPIFVKGDVPLWKQRPSRDDIVPLLVKSESWKELAAVADAIINVSPGWIPSTVFQSPDKFYDGYVLKAQPTDQNSPFVNVKRDNATKAHVSLTLFPLTQPLYLNLTFDLQKDESGVAWPQALRAAFAHSEVQARLEAINPAYIGPFVDNHSQGNKFKTMALMEMLTGVSAELAEWPGRVDPLVESSIKVDDQTDLWLSWLHNPFGSTPLADSLTYSPTIIFTDDLKLQPVTRKVVGSDDQTFILHNCRKSGSLYLGDNYDQADAVDMAWKLEPLSKVFVWSVRLRFGNDAPDQALLEVKQDRRQQPDYYKSP